VIECPRCNNLNAPDATRCSSCGAALAIAAPLSPPERPQPEPVEPERREAEREPDVVAESPRAAEAEPAAEEETFPETVAEEPPPAGEAVTPERGQAVPPPPRPPPRRFSRTEMVLAAIAIAALIAAIAAILLSTRRPHPHPHPHPRRLGMVSAPTPTAFQSVTPVPRATPTLLHAGSRKIHAQPPPVAKAVEPAHTRPPAPAPMRPPPPAPTPTLAPTVKIDSFTVVRNLRRRVCLGYRVEHATSVSITNSATEQAVYSRTLSGQGVAENPEPCIYVKRAGVKGAIGFELVASGHNSQTTRFVTAAAFQASGNASTLP
jgi:hypothetical protein